MFRRRQRLRSNGSCPEPSCRQAITMLARPSCRERADLVHVSHVYALQSVSDRSCRIRVRFSPSGSTQRNVHNHRNWRLWRRIRSDAGSDFDDSHERHNRRTFPQDAQKDRPARPQRVKIRGGTHRTLWGRSPMQWTLANGKTPPVLPPSENLSRYVEGLNDARTMLAGFSASC